MFYRICLIAALYVIPASLHANDLIAVPIISEKDKADATKFISDIRIKSTSGNEIEEAEKILDQSEGIRDEAIKNHAKSIDEIAKATDKSQQNNVHQEWIKNHQGELMAKQAQPLPKVDYGISEKELEKDAIAKMLKNYRLNPDDNKMNKVIGYPLMIFVSASMPQQSLKDLMIQARKYGGVLVFRGVIGSLRNTQQYLAALSKENVSALIDPRLFEMFQVKIVPTFVVLNKATSNCQGNGCDLTPMHDRISGNITLYYALEQIAEGNGNASSTAANLLRKVTGGDK